MVRDWLKSINCKTMVRSHQCVETGAIKLDCGEGFSCYTVFSASNYQGGINEAAFLVFEKGSDEPRVVRHRVTNPGPELAQRNMDALTSLIGANKRSLRYFSYSRRLSLLLLLLMVSIRLDASCALISFPFSCLSRVQEALWGVIRGQGKQGDIIGGMERDHARCPEARTELHQAQGRAAGRAVQPSQGRGGGRRELGGLPRSIPDFDAARVYFQFHPLLAHCMTQNGGDFWCLGVAVVSSDDQGDCHALLTQGC